MQLIEDLIFTHGNSKSIDEMTHSDYLKHWRKTLELANEELTGLHRLF